MRWGTLFMLAVTMDVMTERICAGATEKPYFTPEQSSLIVNVTSKQLFIAWALPRDLKPVLHVLGDEAKLEAFLARTAIHLCSEYSQQRNVKQQPCKVVLLRMKTNDEYTKSAAGGFVAVGKMELPHARVTGESLKTAIGLKRDTLVSWFTVFELKHSRLKP
jgi:hypothetical protein